MNRNPFVQSFLFAVLASLMLISFSCKEEKKESSELSGKEEESPLSNERKKILFFGNSLTAGYGLDEEESFPALIQNMLDSMGYDYEVINGGLSGETSSSGLNRLNWYLEVEPAIFMLELGANDGLRGIELNTTKNNLLAMLDSVHHHYPECQLLLAGMEIPPNMGTEYTKQFREMYPEIASQRDQVTLIPFLLEGVAGDSKLNLPDGIHPTAEGHQLVAKTLWKYLEPLLSKGA